MEMNLLDIIENNIGIIILLCLTFSFVRLLLHFICGQKKLATKKWNNYPVNGERICFGELCFLFQLQDRYYT